MTRPSSLRRFLFSFLLLTLSATLFLGLPHTTEAQVPTRLTAFEGVSLDARPAPFVIEEMEVGNIRHIIDYLLLHGRFNLESGNVEAATAQFQWAASFMDLNAGLTTDDSDEQQTVRAAASKIDALAQRLSEQNTPPTEDVLSALVDAHRALAQYHQSRALGFLESLNANPGQNETLIKHNALHQKKAGFALSAALTHFDRAVRTAGDLEEGPMDPMHRATIDDTYQITKALKIAGGQVDPAKARSATESLGGAIRRLEM